MEYCLDEVKFWDKGECKVYCNDKEWIYMFRNFIVGIGGKKIYDYYCFYICLVNMFIFSLMCVL